MGYAYYELYDGREAGYEVAATCDEPGCAEEIYRGLSFLCGESPAIYAAEPEFGCGKYFCFEHLYYPDSAANQACCACTKLIDGDTSDW